MGRPPISYEQIASHYWWHTIDLGNGLVTPGEQTREVMDSRFALTFDQLDLRGKTVLDVGAWDGGFSIEAKRRGAKRVIALDHVTWNMPDVRSRETFDLAVRACGLEIEAFDQDLDAPRLSFTDLLSYAKLPAFDIVLFLGVFYHLMDPLAATRELAAITRETLVLETHLEDLSETRPAMIFYPGTELNEDPTNWWGPNRQCIEELLGLCGFNSIEFAMDGRSRGFFHGYKQALPGAKSKPSKRGQRSAEGLPSPPQSTSGQVSRSDVIEAYLIVLRREPENEQAIQEHMASATIAELYRGLIESEEFQQNFKTDR